MFEALAYIMYTKERYCFSLLCTLIKVIKNIEVKVDVQKGALRYREKFDNRLVRFIQFAFSSIVVIW